MKRRATSPTTHWYLPAVVLYRDDLDVLVQALHEAGYILRFSDDEYDFDDLEELIKVRGTKPSVLHIDGDNRTDDDVPRYMGRASVEIRRWDLFRAVVVEIPASDRNAKLRETVLDTFRRRRRWHSRVLIRGVWSNIAILLGAAFVFTALNSETHAIAKQLFGAGIIALLAAILAYMTSHGWCSKLNLLHRHATTNFFTRNADKLIGGAIGAALAAIVTVVVKNWIDGK